MSSQLKVAIIVLNWNNYTDTLSCLDSVSRLNYGSYQIIVIDNGSANDSVAIIAEAYPNITILEAGKNLGYTGGNNLGIRHVLNKGCDYIWLLNDDVIVDPNSLSTLIAVAGVELNAGFLGPKVYIREDRRRILSCGGFFDSHWEPRQQGIGDVDTGQFDTIAEVDYLSGCALLVSKKAIEKIGMLDEDFFAYHEDIEWCYRGKQAGFTVLCVSDAQVWHPDTRQRDENAPLVTYYIARNSLLFSKKYYLGTATQIRLLIRYIRTLLSWTLRPKWRYKHKQRNALWQALLDFTRGRFGYREF